MVARNLKEELAKKATDTKAPVIVVRPSKLEDAMKAGFLTEALPKTATPDQVANARKVQIVDNVVAKGTYEKTEPNRFDDKRKDFYIKDEDGTLYIINATQNLAEQFNLIAGLEGKVKIEVKYNGKLTSRSGRKFHDFEVKVED